MLIRPGESEGNACDRVLIPAAGGRHSLFALQLAQGLLEQGTKELVPFYVEADFGELSEEVGMATLLRNMGKAGLREQEGISPRIRIRDRFESGLVKEAEEGEYDLIVVGASDSGRIHNYLFGSIPERLLRGHKSVTIAVIRAADPMLHQLRTRFEKSLSLTVPQLGRRDRIALFEGVQRHSRWNFDFLTLITLSTSIAALGLVQSSTAVVIGAMLVAPLMTPLLGSGLSLVQRNLPLALQSLKAIRNGFLVALLISFLVGLLSPITSLTPELLSRTEPSLLDLGVAFLSGVAAAYCTARPRLSAALPGVAIAAALVPPIATTGIAVAIGDTSHALGAATLFGTNVVAIVLGSALCFYLAGIRGNRQQLGKQRWVVGATILLLLSILGLSLPLGSTLFQQFSQEKWSRVSLSQPSRQQLEVYLRTEWDATLLKARMRRSGDGIAAGLTVERRAPLPIEGAEQIADYLRELTSQPVTCRIAVTLIAEAESTGPGSSLRRTD